MTDTDNDDQLVNDGSPASGGGAVEMDLDGSDDGWVAGGNVSVDTPVQGDGAVGLVASSGRRSDRRAVTSLLQNPPGVVQHTARGRELPRTPARTVNADLSVEELEAVVAIRRRRVEADIDAMVAERHDRERTSRRSVREASAPRSIARRVAREVASQP